MRRRRATGQDHTVVLHNTQSLAPYPPTFFTLSHPSPSFSPRCPIIWESGIPGPHCHLAELSRISTHPHFPHHISMAPHMWATSFPHSFMHYPPPPTHLTDCAGILGLSSNDECGPHFNSGEPHCCDDGECCGSEGFCGTGPDFCASSSCQAMYGVCWTAPPPPPPPPPPPAGARPLSPPPLPSPQPPSPPAPSETCKWLTVGQVWMGVDGAGRGRCVWVLCQVRAWGVWGVWGGKNARGVGGL